MSEQRDKHFSHLDETGGVRMVDVGGKAATQRIAVAEAVVELSEETMRLLEERALPKGDVLTCAKIAGIMAAKRTSELIPMCHPLSLSLADVRFRVEGVHVFIECETRTTGPTGVEMEAIVGAQAAAATIYDMCKAVQRDIVIRRVRLLRKEGGRSGLFQARDMPL
ncbi:MAG: cyclic pyranopterin monophosphate synthase MoaC [Desulfovibrionaceae bacterium]|nr:cyclic pyranopterin monophosphate synthase MoaC [Desulfovibrionaceae bacterium]